MEGYSKEELIEVHNALDKKIAKMEKERQTTRWQDHRDELKNLKKEKLALKDYIYNRNWDISDSGVEDFS